VWSHVLGLDLQAALPIGDRYIWPFCGDQKYLAVDRPNFGSRIVIELLCTIVVNLKSWRYLHMLDQRYPARF
jgi:hypothetical protein